MGTVTFPHLFMTNYTKNETSNNGTFDKTLTPEQQAILDQLTASNDEPIVPQFSKDDTWQRKLLSGLLQNEQISKSIEIVRPEYFSNDIHKAIFTILQSFWNKHRALPTQFIVDSELTETVKTDDAAKQLHYRAECQSVYEYYVPGLVECKHFEEQVKTFAQTQALTLAMQSVHKCRDGEIDPLKAMADIGRELRDIVVRTSESKKRIFTLGEFMERPRSEILVRRHIVSRAMNLIYGGSGIGKSFFAIELAMSIALGRSVFGKFPCRQGKVLYLVSEAAGCFGVRFEAWIKRHEVKLTDAAENLRLLDGSFDFQKESMAEDLADELNQVYPGYIPSVVFVDTVACNAGGDENNPKDMQRFVTTCHDIMNKFGCAVVLIHHEGKDKTRGARGHSVLPFACQSIINIDGEPEGSELVVRNKKFTAGKTFKSYKLDKTIETVNPDDEDYPDSIVLSFAGETNQDEEDKLAIFAGLFDDNENKAVTLKEIQNRDTGILTEYGWKELSTLKDLANKAVKQGLLFIHPDDEGKKGVRFRYYSSYAGGDVAG